MATNVYLAGHIHDNWRDEFELKIHTAFYKNQNQEKAKINWLKPIRSVDFPFGKSGNDRRHYVPNDIQLINRADVIFFNLEKNHGNIGGAWETGYAYAKNIPVYLLDKDPENYRYDIIRSVSFVFTEEKEIIDAILMLTLNS